MATPPSGPELAAPDGGVHEPARQSGGAQEPPPLPRRRWIIHSKSLALAALAGLLGFLLAEAAVRVLAPAREVGASFSEYDPYYGKRLKTSVSLERTTPEFTMRLTTNSLGFRGPEPEGDPRGALLFFGDSFTMGYGVDDGSEFPEIVRRALGVPVVNAGIGDSGTGRWLKFLARDAPRFEPRLVVLQLQQNDVADNRRERLFSLDAQGSLVELAPPPPDIARRLQRWIDAVPGLSSMHLVAKLHQALRAPRQPGAFAPLPGAAQGPEPPDPLTLAIVEAALARCGERGWPVIGLLAEVRGEHARALTGLFVRRGYPVLVVPPKPERPDLYFAIDGHWNAAGHRFAAEMLLAELRRQGDP